jgi:hypothetical protein
LEDLFALILERRSPRPVAEMGRLLACHLPIHAADATAMVRYGGGLVARDLPAGLAGELALRLGEIGVLTRTIESSRWAAAPRGSRATSLEFRAETLTATLRGRPYRVAVPRPDVLGIRVHGITVESPREEDGERGGRRRKRPAPAPGIAVLEETAVGPEAALLSPRAREILRRLKENGIASMDLHLTIYCAEPRRPAGEEAGWRWSPLRIAKSDFDYSCLREQKQAHSLDNFLILLEDVLAYLPEAWNREAAARFLASLDPLEILQFKEEEAENFDRWMLEWMRIERAERDAGGKAP